MTVTDLADKLIDLARLSLLFGRTERATFHEDGKRPETDTDHTVMLGLAACALAKEVGGLDVGLVAQFAFVHDLVEAYAGDTPTLRMPTDAAKAGKKAREQAAFERIMREFGLTLPWIDRTIAAYERQVQPEARFVRALDKVLPKLTHILNGCVTPKAQGATAAELRERYAEQERDMAGYAGDFPVVLEVRGVLVERMLAVLERAEVPAVAVEAVVDVGSLTPTQLLILETLAARTRLGHHRWPFDARLRQQLVALHRLGLIQIWNDVEAELTSVGRAAVMVGDYAVPDVLRQRDEAQERMARVVRAAERWGGEHHNEVMQILAGGEI